MKKVLFLMILLLLMGLGAAGVKAQVRIGGNTPPNPAAALDLNAAEGTTTGTKGLALPRVTLGSNTATLDGTTANITGMLIYNTGGTLSTGVYYWNGANWNRVDDGLLGGDTIVGNEVTGATINRGLVRAGSGTATSPFTLGIAAGGIDSSMLKLPSFTGQSILVAYNGVWHYAHLSYLLDNSASYAANETKTFNVPTHTCIEPLWLETFGSPGAIYAGFSPTSEWIVFAWSPSGTANARVRVTAWCFD